MSTPPPLVIPCQDCTGYTALSWYDGWVGDSAHDAPCPVYRDVPGMRRDYQEWVKAEASRVTLVADYGDDFVFVHSCAGPAA